jgi:hypothetical protein
MSTLPLEEKMSVSSTYSVAPRHRTVEFGDGYIQRTPLGLQHSRRSISVIHQNLDPTQADTLIQFYETKMHNATHIDIGANGLLRTPGEFYLQTFDVEMTSPEIRTVSAQMIEVYDL